MANYRRITQGAPRRPRIWQLAGLSGLGIALVLSGCGRVLAESPDPTGEVVFAAPQAQLDTGQRLAPLDSHWDGYGEAVDVHGDGLVIGASEWNYDRDGRGTAYVYRQASGEWLLEAQLTASDRAAGQQGQRFGSSVAMGATTIAVGAPGTDDPLAGVDRGAVYIFEQAGSTWVEAAKLTPSHVDSDGAAAPTSWLRRRMGLRSFGALVALAGDTVAVSGDVGAESIYVFQRVDGGWQQQARLPIPGSPDQDVYPVSLALFGNTLALSTLTVPRQVERPPVLAGQVMVYVFERAGATWTESFRFNPAPDETELLFIPEVNVGASVALGGAAGRANRLAIGLSGFPDWSTVQDSPVLVGAQSEAQPIFPATQRAYGAVYLLERGEDGAWNLRTRLKPAGWESAPGPGPLFNYFSAATLAERATFDEAALLATSVFPGHWYSADPALSFFGATVDLDGDRLAVTAGFANATYVFERRGSTWVYGTRLTPQKTKAEVWEDYAQVVRLSGETVLLGTPGEFGNSAYVFNLAAAAADGE